MALCKNEEMNSVGLGLGLSYPRSCPTCKFGPCQQGVTRVDGSSLEERYYVNVAQESKVENKYAVITLETVSESDGYGGYNSTKYQSFNSFDTEAELIEWYKNNVLNGSYSKPIVKKLVRYQELTPSTEVTVKLG